MWSRLPGRICPGKIGFLQSSLYEHVEQFIRAKNHFSETEKGHNSVIN